MCGIGGIMNWAGPVREVHAQKMLHALKHRGPDDLRVKTFFGGALVHARLAILDPERGTQPVLSKDGNLSLVFNGEIYNFKELRNELQAKGYEFRTDCDAEVVLAAYQCWGAESLKRLTGMFAFAIYDENQKELFLARDRMGIKPLVYCQTPRSFYFASEIQALLTQDEISKTIDPGALDDYLHYQYVPEPRTIFKTLKKLPAAHYLKISQKRPDAQPVSYWALEFSPNHTKSEKDWMGEMEALLEQVVKEHLISDVPFGAFLSGGIDSSTVVYHMSRHLNQPVKTFTIGFDETSCDESRHAEKVAKIMGCEHRTEIIRPSGLEIIDELAGAYGEPFADSSALAAYFVSKLAVNSGVKMVLSGDGGDELFAGYNTYEKILGAAGSGFGFLSRIFPAGSDNGFLREHSRIYAYFQDAERQKLYTRDFRDALRKDSDLDFRIPIFQKSHGWEPVSRLQHLDIYTYLRGDILTKMDIASMRHSLEVRVPLLDHRFVEFAARIPARFKLKPGRNAFQKKYLLTEYAVSKISPELRRPKQGFGIPLADWLSGAFYPQLVDRMKDTNGFFCDFFDTEELECYARSRETVKNHAPRIWALLMLQSWANRFMRRSPDYAHAV